MIVNGAHHSIPRLARTCQRLTVELGIPVRANIYMTPPGAQGFSRHSDDHEVVVLQIHGSKAWRLFPEAGAEIEFELNEGDLLYIPSGLDHVANTQSRSSVHVTLGLNPIYAYQLVEELATIARKSPAFQTPVGSLFGAADGAGLSHSEFQERLKALLLETPVSLLLDRHGLKYVGEQAVGWDERFLDVLRLPSLTLDSVVRRRSEVAVLTTVRENSIEVQFAGEKVTIPLFLEQFLAHLLDADPVIVRELRGLLSDEGRIEITRAFVRSGLVAIVQL